MKFLLLFLCVVKILRAQEDAVLCSGQTCSTYITENPCAALPEKCKIQNSTYNGLFLPSPDPCGCCQYCLENLNENEFCARGEVGGLIPESICGPGLTCFQDVQGADSRCVKMTDAVTKDDTLSTLYPCSKAQADYDKRREEETSGFLETRPDCDDDGLYQPYKCVLGQTCFCVDKLGKRIFGEIPFTSTADLNLKCECSRKYHEVLKFFDKTALHPNQHFRCASNGDYDTIQCIGDACMCTDAQDGAPTFPNEAPVNISLISSTTLPNCFKKNLHKTNKYYHACAEKYLSILEELEGYKSDGYDTVFEMEEYPKCDLEGQYAPVQKNETTDPVYYYCSFPNGTQIGEYQGSDETDMDCNCARTLLLMEGALEKPQCCQNGNFNPVQCRRGTCYCVDADGSQDVNKPENTEGEIEVSIYEKTNLFCYKEDEQQKCAGTASI